MEKINLEDYVYTGEGANGISYASRSNPYEMLKIYNAGYPVGNVVEELENARKLYGIGVPTPEPGVLVTDGERVGIRFRRIVGKRSYARMLADEPERIDELSRELAREYKKFHSIIPPEGLFNNVKEQYLRMLEADRSLTADEHEKMAGIIAGMPDGQTMLHGDMHLGNAISTLPEGASLESPHDIYFIDLQDVACGYPLFDFGMLHIMCHVSEEDFRVHDYHITGAQASRVWDSFIDEYFFSDDCLAERFFGPGQTPESVTEAIIPYTCIKCLLIGFNLDGIIPEHYVNYMRRNVL